MNSEFDGFMGLLAAGAFIAGITLAAFLFGFIILPAGIVGGGVWYYYRNVYAPKKSEERQTDRTRRLYQEASSIAPTHDRFAEHLDDIGLTDDTLRRVAYKLYLDEGLAPPDEPPAVADTIAAARYRDQLMEYNQNAKPQRFTEFLNAITNALLPLQTDNREGGMFHSKSPCTPEQINDMIMAFFDSEGCFKRLRTILDRNFNEQKAVLPKDYKGDNCAFDYLKDTPLMELEYTDQYIDLEDRTRHTYILGSSGSGKTNLIEHVIAHDLEEDCCIVVIDSQVQLIPKLAKLDLPVDDVTYITPQWDIGLNLFDVGYKDMKAGGIEGETLINKTVGLISFVLEGMMGAELTNPQKTLFQYAIQLVISIPGGNIFTFINLLADDGHLEYEKEINTFDANTQRFFYRDFGSDEYKRTREAIRRRLDSLLTNPTFRRMFSAADNRIDMYEELQQRKLILIDTNKPMLDDDASAFFGRLFIAMIVQASHRRFDNQDKTYKRVYLIVDEAHEYFDNKISEMLEQARKSNIGLIISHQSMSQARGDRGKNIIDPIMVNTATKLVWTGYKEDAAKMAGSMATTAEAIMSLPQYTFGLYSRKTGFVHVRARPDPLSYMDTRYNLDELRTAIEERYRSSNPIDFAAFESASETSADSETREIKQKTKKSDDGWDEVGDVDPI